MRVKAAGQDVTVTEAQARALRHMAARGVEGKRTSAGDAVKANTLAALAAKGLARPNGNVWHPSYTLTALGLSTARALTD